MNSKRRWPVAAVPGGPSRSSGPKCGGGLLNRSAPDRPGDSETHLLTRGLLPGGAMLDRLELGLRQRQFSLNSVRAPPICWWSRRQADTPSSAARVAGKQSLVVRMFIYFLPAVFGISP
jgi:hypothetical protein